MAEIPDKTPHWAWPHVIAVLVGIVAYIAIFRFTGDADFMYTIIYALALGGVAWTASWAYLFPPGFLKKK